jgi:hypothetical protein
MLAPEVQATTIAIRVPLALDRSQCRKILRYTPGHWPFQNLCTSLPKLRATQMLAPSKATPVEPPLALKLPIIWPSLARNSCSPVPSVSQMLSSTKCRSRLLNRNHLLGSPSGRTGTSQLCETIAVRRSIGGSGFQSPKPFKNTPAILLRFRQRSRVDRPRFIVRKQPPHPFDQQRLTPVK